MEAISNDAWEIERSDGKNACRGAEGRGSRLDKGSRARTLFVTNANKARFVYVYAMGRGR